MARIGEIKEGLPAQEYRNPCDQVRCETTMEAWIGEARRVRNESCEIVERLERILTKLRGEQPATGHNSVIGEAVNKVEKEPPLCEQMRRLNEATNNNIAHIRATVSELEEHI